MNILLTKTEIRTLLDALGHEVIVQRTGKFPYTIICPGMGYSSDPKIAALQGKLSIMLEAAPE